MIAAMPPLRNHRDEIPLLANLFLAHLNLELGKQLHGFDPQAVSILQDYSWPGNYIQFRRILLEATVATPAAYISAGTTADLIVSEQQSRTYRTLFAGEDTHLPSLTLEEMTKKFRNSPLQ